MGVVGHDGSLRRLEAGDPYRVLDMLELYFRGLRLRSPPAFKKHQKNCCQGKGHYLSGEVDHINPVAEPSFSFIHKLTSLDRHGTIAAKPKPR